MSERHDKTHTSESVSEILNLLAVGQISVCRPEELMSPVEKANYETKSKKEAKNKNPT